MKRSMGGLPNDDLTSISKRVKLKEDIFAAVNKSKTLGSFPKRTDYSVFRTPSGFKNKFNISITITLTMYCTVGQYYCAACNVSLNSESQFGQHQVGDKGEGLVFIIFCVLDQQETQTEGNFSEIKKKMRYKIVYFIVYLLSFRNFLTIIIN